MRQLLQGENVCDLFNTKIFQRFETRSDHAQTQ
jgi:hypothetical protein